MSETVNADICVIGAGSGGLSVAAGAAMFGRKVVLIEQGEMGGDCLNTGCVPSKALIAAAARAHAIRTAAPFGVKAADPAIDFAAVMDHVHEVIAEIAPIDSQERFEGLGVTVLRERAAFSGPRQVKAGPTTVNAKHVVIATGSSPSMPPVEGLDSVSFFTNETIFENRTQPEHLVILGGGPVGVEMAQAFRRLGSAVTLVERETILAREDPELVGIIRAQLKEEGVRLLEQCNVERAAQDGGVSLVAGGETIRGSHLLIATGRKPNVGGLDLEAAGVDYDAAGVKVDRRLRTANKRIYAIGDVTGGRQFTHVAGYHASIVIRNILFKLPAANNDRVAPRVTYADPELAHVGLTESEAKAQNPKARSVRWAFGENDRARAELKSAGLIKVTAAPNGRILGASIAGQGAGDLIQPWAQAVAEGRNIKSFTAYIAPYPTRGEIAKRAAGEWFAPALFSNRTKMLLSLLAMFD